MGRIEKQANVAVSELIPYKNNAKTHSEEQIKRIAESIKEFGFLNPVLIDRKNNLIAGHGRIAAAKLLGITSVPCVYVEGLTEAQRRAYILADNRLTELGEWDMTLVAQELTGLEEFGFNTTLTGFSFTNKDADWFENRERNDTSRQEGNDEYNEFLDKFELEKTTDDCYTPDKVYDAVAEWVVNEYGLDRAHFVRPFYPGGDYQKYKYKKNDVVVDNPPFSILSEILKWYTEHGIKFFLFAPALTLFSSSSSSCAIGAGAQIIYENGASVNTSFLTNLEMEYRFRSSPSLHDAVEDAVAEILKEQKKQLPKNDYPNEVVLSTMLNRYSKYGIDFRVRREESVHVRQLDEQKESGKALFGSGYLISERAASERAASERAASERAASEKWSLSDRERQIVKSLGGGS